MKLICLSIAHDKAPVAMREKFALKPHDSARLGNLFINSNATEALTLSTCNRTEVYLVTPKETELDVISSFTSFFGINPKCIEEVANLYHNAQALEHLFSLACGVRSMVVGETEILGQIKKAYADAVSENLTGKILNRSLQRAFSLAKQIRSGTEIGKYRVSVANVAVNEIIKIIGDNKSACIAVWGTGSVGKAVCNAFDENGFNGGTILTRSAQENPQSKWQQRHSDTFRESLATCDIFVTCTGAPHPVIHATDIPPREKPLLIFDLALPRDTSEDIKNLAHVSLYDLDDLSKIIASNKDKRENIKLQVAPIIKDEAEKFWRCLDAASGDKCITDWRLDVHDMLEEEMQNLQEKWPDMPEEVQEQIHHVCNRIMHRMLHWPSQSIKRAIREGLPCADFFDGDFENLEK